MIFDYLPIIADALQMGIAIYRKRQRDIENALPPCEDDNPPSALSTRRSDDDVIYVDDILTPVADTWVEAGEKMTIGSFEITGGLFFTDELQLADADDAFLNWLASDRVDAEAGDDVLFRYLAGLERRVLIDAPRRGVPSSRLSACFKEAARLRRVYSTHTEFVRALKRFACISWILTHNIQLSVAAPIDIDKDFCDESCRKLLPWRIAHFAVQFRPLPPAVLCAWYDAHPDFGLPQTAKDHFDEFYCAFEKEYTRRFPQGMRTKPSHDALTVTYRSSVPHLGTLAFPIAGGYDAFNQTEILSAIKPVVQFCASEQQLAAHST